jgi:hypothetical protein
MNVAGDPVTIIDIGAEGGSIKVLARSDGASVEYSVRMRDQTLTFLEGDEKGPEIRRDSGWTESWDQAVKLLARWPWPMLYPVFVHADYRERVLLAVQQFRGRDGQPARASAIKKWEEACHS